jgi:hypothetical protein
MFMRNVLLCALIALGPVTVPAVAGVNVSAQLHELGPK